MPDLEAAWPPLSHAADGETIAILHLASQIVGKVAVALIPWRNHGWHLALHPGARGLSTEPIHHHGRTFDLTLDMVDPAVVLRIAGGAEVRTTLQGVTIADLHRATLAMLIDAGLPVTIHGAPNEVDPATPFAADTAARAFDPASAARVHRALLDADRVLRRFRSAFLGKVSPVHFFWGSFDLAVTRFSGRDAPPHPGGIPNLPDAVTREAYSHEVSSAGFWPGGAGNDGDPFFYSYAYPSPPGFADAPVAPGRFDTKLGEFVLPYAEVRAAADPDAALLAFLQTSYAAAADHAGWDRATLECALGEPRVPRRVA